MTPQAGSSPRSSGGRPLWPWIARVLASVAVMVAIFSVVPSGDVWHMVRSTPLSVWTASLLIFLLGHVISAFKWRILIGGAAFAARRVLVAHFAGLAANLCLPGAAGGDVLRAGMLFHDAEDKTLLAVGSLADRLLDIVGLLLLALAGWLCLVEQRPGSTRAMIAASLLVLVLGAAGCVALWVALHARLPARFEPLRAKLVTALDSVRRRPRDVLSCLCLSMVVQASFIMVNVWLASTHGLEIPVAAWFFAWPLAKLVSIAPISLGGLGVREASLAAFAAPFGAPTALTIAVGLLWQSILFASGLLGALLLVLSRRGRAAQPRGSASEPHELPARGSSHPHPRA
ncbi:MAG: hypothetical protein JWN48_1383 [Myxococcaceae bacterium]|nr:hypothetical protein [Myxococcaceae bacterium]